MMTSDEFVLFIEAQAENLKKSVGFGSTARSPLLFIISRLRDH
jgi:hypothetical protein